MRDGIDDGKNAIEGQCYWEQVSVYLMIFSHIYLDFCLISISKRNIHVLIIFTCFTKVKSTDYESMSYVLLCDQRSILVEAHEQPKLDRRSRSLS